MNGRELLKLRDEAGKAGVLSAQESDLLNLLVAAGDRVTAEWKAGVLFMAGCRLSGGNLPHLAIKAYRGAIESGREREDVYYNLGNALRKTGDSPEAMRAYTKALTINPGMALAYFNRGLCRHDVGDQPGALEDFREAAARDCDFAPLYQTLASLQVRMGGFESLAVLATQKSLPVRARRFLRTNLEEQLGSLTAFLASAPEHGVDLTSSVVLRARLADTMQGAVLRRLEFRDQVRNIFEAVKSAQEGGDPELVWRALYVLGLLPYAAYAEQIGSQGGHDRDDVPNSILALAFNDEGAEGDLLEDWIARVMPGCGGASRRVRFAHFAKQAFADAVSTLIERPLPRGMPPSLQAANFQWWMCEDLFRELVRTCIYLQDVDRYLWTTAQARYRHAWGFVPMEAGPQLPADAYIKILRTNGLPIETAELPLWPGTAVLDYFVFEIVEDTIACGAATSSGTLLTETFVSTASSPGGATDLSTLLRMNTLWQKPGLIPSDAYPQRLDETLLRPQQETLRGCSRVVILPFNYLHNIPFHALRTLREGVDRDEIKEIVYVPSLRTLARCHRRVLKDRAALSCLFVGFAAAGDLSIEQELRIVKRHFQDCRVLKGKDASAAAVLAAMPGFDVVHFCCHAGHDAKRNAAYLALADGPLYPTQILGLGQFAPELVLANACITGVGSRTFRNGDQVLGLQNAFLFAGARQVIGTMWPIENEAAVSFAREFYDLWLTDQELSTGQALLATQKRLKQQFKDLGAWAPHALFGDWR